MIGSLAAGLVVAAFVGLRAALIATCLLLTAPGMFGEGEGRYSFVFVVTACLSLIGVRPNQLGHLRIGLLLAPFLVFLGIAWSLPESRAWSVVFLASTVFAWLIQHFRMLAKQVALAAVLFVCLISSLYAMSLMLRRLESSELVRIGARSVFETSPWSYTQTGTRLSFVNQPRLLMAVGEPGQNVYLILVAMFGVGLIAALRWRMVAILLILFGIVFSQSQTVLIASLGAFIAFLIINTAVNGRILRAAGLAVIGFPVLVYAAFESVASRSADSASTLRDRGLGDGARLAGADQDAINVLRALANFPELAVLVIAAFIVLMASTLSAPASFALTAGVGLTAFFSQPIWGAPAVFCWLAIVHTATRRTPNEAASAAAIPTSPPTGLSAFRPRVE